MSGGSGIKETEWVIRGLLLGFRWGFLDYGRTVTILPKVAQGSGPAGGRFGACAAPSTPLTSYSATLVEGLARLPISTPSRTAGLAYEHLQRPLPEPYLDAEFCLRPSEVIHARAGIPSCAVRSAAFVLALLVIDSPRARERVKP
jgi:hypothetical protein